MSSPQMVKANHRPDRRDGRSEAGGRRSPGRRRRSVQRFYEGLGWRLDIDFANGPDFRAVQMTPPGSACSIHFGKGITTAEPGSVRNLYLAVSDMATARAELTGVAPT